MNLRETLFEDWKWMELDQDRVLRLAAVLAVLNLQILLPQC